MLESYPYEYYERMSGAMHSQGSQDENTRKTNLLGRGDGQAPNDGHRHDENYRVRNDVRDLEPVVELGEVHAATG